MAEAAGPWAVIDPRPGRAAIAYTDADSAAALARAVRWLVARRSPSSPSDAGATVSVLVSLIAEADAMLAEAVADARDQGYTWEEVALRLATTASAARHRWGSYARWKRSLPLATD
jgi:hypothetical protein